MSSSTPKRRRRPATNPEAREQQLISLAYDLVEKRLIEGSASAQETTHFLKAGSARSTLESRRLENENLLLAAKVNQIESAEKQDELYKAAMAAFSVYSGQEEGYDI